MRYRSIILNISIVDLNFLVIVHLYLPLLNLCLGISRCAVFLLVICGGLSGMSSNPIKSYRCKPGQETLPSLLGTG